MRGIPQIGIYMHKTSALHALQMESIATYTRCHYDLLISNEPGTVHENINKVLSRVTSRYFVLLDDDCILTHTGWLERLIQLLKDNPTVGMLSCLEVKNLRTLRVFKKNPKSLFNGVLPEIIRTKWLPGYLMAMDMDRVPGLRADEAIPFPKGMSDLDLSLQVTSRGLSCGLATDVLVYHPYKGPVTDEQITESRSQKLYMFNKWGKHYVDAASSPMGSLMNAGESLEEDDADNRSRSDYTQRFDQDLGLSLAGFAAEAPS